MYDLIEALDYVDRVAAAGVSLLRDDATVGMPKMAQVGVLYDGLASLGGGATLAGIILGAVPVDISDRAFDKATCFAVAGSILTFFGFIHGPDGLGIGRSPTLALS